MILSLFVEDCTLDVDLGARDAVLPVESDGVSAILELIVEEHLVAVAVAVCRPWEKDGLDCLSADNCKIRKYSLSDYKSFKKVTNESFTDWSRKNIPEWD